MCGVIARSWRYPPQLKRKEPHTACSVAVVESVERDGIVRREGDADDEVFLPSGAEETAEACDGKEDVLPLWQIMALPTATSVERLHKVCGAAVVGCHAWRNSTEIGRSRSLRVTPVRRRRNSRSVKPEKGVWCGGAMIRRYDRVN